ncbi:hypothetical protein LCGC14_0274780 [marine sediment metagenome]|uniref:Glycosyltransferase RgtA/B/C/D-like domain-containing protein n=1 Tax=marine sediment metagenome TaxID=412755 RepID=A0A0F9TXW9_9ZZZZ|nr:hypothetical protein [Phycisphaerae bacterium]HDZ43384.1 hypothetical protein [Phycisphaerae bacterium]
MKWQRPILNGLAGRSELVIFALIFVICLGLGYPTLQRFDPRDAQPDSKSYYQMVRGEDEGVNPTHRYRILTPALAAGVLALLPTVGFVEWDRTFLAMLIVNSAFTAGAATLLLPMCRRLHYSNLVGGVAALLLVSSFLVANLILVGLVDAGELFFFCALLTALLSGRLGWLVPLAIMGVLAKDSMAAFVPACMVGWCLGARKGDLKTRPLIHMAAAALASIATLVVGRAVIGGPATHVPEAGWQHIASLPYNFLECVVFVVLLLTFLPPLAVWRLGRMPRTLLLASFLPALVGIALSAYWAGNQNAARQVFDTAGPVLAIAAAICLHDVLAGKA